MERRVIREIKTPRDAKGVTNTKTRPTTLSDVMYMRVPARTIRNVKGGHLIKGIRDIQRIGKKPWEMELAETMRIIAKQGIDKASCIYIALDKINRALAVAEEEKAKAQKMAEELETANEEMQATNEELQASTEEMEATNEEMQATTEELERTNAYRQTLMDSMPDILMTTDQRGVITEVNPASERISGYSRQELIGQPFRQFFTDPKHAQAGIKQVIREEKVSDYDLTVLTKDGREVPVSYNATVLRTPKGRITGVLGSARDITESKRAEEKLQKLLGELKESQTQLVQAGKMSAMGTMTAGVAHELNNPMMGILNFVGYCLKRTSKKDKRYTVLQDAERETKRCVDIVQSLLTFARMEKEGTEAFEKQSLNVILDRIFELLSYRIETQNVSVARHTAEETPEIWMSVNNIQQVFLNLINNALEATEKSEKKEIHVDIHPEGDFVQVTVADSGCGIPPENLERIFDPFFTTKPAGLGVGLGLSVSYSIVKAHGGDMTCESELGAGTKFKILLPIERRKTKEGIK